MEITRTGKQHRPVDALVYSCSTHGRNIFLKLLYLYLQYELPENEVYEFYLQFPEFFGLQENERITFFERLFNESNSGPLKLDGNLLSALEKYLSSRNIDFHSRFRQFIENSLKFRPDFINLSIFEHFQPILKQVNLKKHLLTKAHMIPTIIMPDVSSFLIEFGSNSLETFAIIAISSPSTQSPVDMESGIESILQFFPVLFGTTPFSGFTIIAQEASVFEKTKDCCFVSTANEAFYINNECIGAVMDFRRFNQDRGITDQNRFSSFAKVYVPEKDYFCKKRNRIILKKGCAYGAPICIVRLFQSIDETNEKEQFNFTDIPQNHIWSKIGQKHEELLSLLNSNLCVTFNKRLQSLSINDVFITSGVQAKILCTIFRHYLKKGHSEFEWNEFAAEEEFICDPYSTGLSTRLKRAMNCLAKATKDIILEKYGRGKYRLICKKKVFFSEI